jgi:hypothetical protein
MLLVLLGLCIITEAAWVDNKAVDELCRAEALSNKKLQQRISKEYAAELLILCLMQLLYIIVTVYGTCKRITPAMIIFVISVQNHLWPKAWRYSKVYRVIDSTVCVGLLCWWAWITT